jgi:hypothetical protein
MLAQARAEFGVGALTAFALRKDEKRALWATHKGWLLSHWIAEHPGTRPEEYAFLLHQLGIDR